MDTVKTNGITSWDKNPLRNWPKYDPCFCGSGAKATFCCLPRQPRWINAVDAEQLARAMAVGEHGRQAIRKEFQRHADTLLQMRVSSAREQNPKTEVQNEDGVKGDAAGN
jgi:hypothetical protein